MEKKRQVSLLYAEDEPQARELLAKLIRHKFPEMTVYLAADGEQGMYVYRQHRPGLILTDIMMPVLDGIEMSKRIREIDPGAYIIALTAYNDTEWQDRSEELRLNKCITKPIEFRTLLECLGEAIEYLHRKDHPTI